MGQTQPHFVYFGPVLNTSTNAFNTKFDYKTVDCVLGIHAWDH